MEPRNSKGTTSLDERRDAIERSVAEITANTGVDLQVRLQGTVVLGPGNPMLAAIVLQAGRDVPAGLSAARRMQRQTRGTEALAWLRKNLHDLSLIHI